MFAATTPRGIVVTFSPQACTQYNGFETTAVTCLQELPQKFIAALSHCEGLVTHKLTVTGVTQK